jgi:septal ring-binding cell division protein DamX
MFSCRTSILIASMMMALILNPIVVRAETVAIPVFLDYRQLQLLLMRDTFKGPQNTAEYLLDDHGCTRIRFSEPHLSTEGTLLRVDANIFITIGVPQNNACTVITRWNGGTVATGKPVLVGDHPLSVEFKVQTARLYDQHGRLLTDGLVLQMVNEQLHLLLSRYRLDLKPETDRLKALLPYFLPHYPANRLTGMIDSLRIDDLEVQADGLDVRLSLDVETVAKSEPEPTLSEIEMQQLEQRLQSWDAFLTFVIKEAAAATRSEKLRTALLEILLDTRHRFTSILTEPSQDATDPVKQLFVQSWERLKPIMREISVHLPQQNLLSFLTFMTAADALGALDRLGPAVGLDVSADGLRRLARLLNDDPSFDPLKYLNEIDPQLQQLFGFGIPGEISQPKKSHGFHFQLIRPAYAADPGDRLNHWVPSPAELNAYLLEIRNLLLDEAESRIHSSSLATEHARIFRYLMLTTAWQESCWRQYIVKNRKIVPLISGSGDIGMLQINEKVWRGFYSPAKLRWDITYNTRAGSEILLKLMVNYALKRQEDKHGGNLSNLARATYSAYNGGPSQVSRYRKNNVPAAYKKIDTAFWNKYQQVSQGKELAVAQCLGGQVPSSKTTAPQTSGGRQQSDSKKVTPDGESRRIENIAWIKERRPDHFTLQLAAMSSEQAVKEFIGQQSPTGSFAYYRKRQKGRNLYVAIYGSFAVRADAQKAAARFAPLNPWVRDFGSIQETISK